MKYLLLVAVASAAIGAGIATLLRDVPPAPLPPVQTPTRLDARDIELAFVRALERTGFGERARPPTVHAAEPLAAPPESSKDGSPRTPANPVLPAANQRALEGVRSFEEDEQLRRTWIFRPEKDVIEWLGTPDAVYASEGAENWRYDLPNGDEILLQFHGGRLLQILR